MKDLFSRNAKQYAQFRPTYPEELYSFIFQYVGNKQNAWDVGTGNGQVAQALASFFEQVYATDISQKQLDEAVRLPNIQYLCCNEYKTPFAKHTFDLITVGQAIHWFNFDLFYKEIQRVAKKGAIIAVWGYNLLQISPQIDQLIREFYKEKVGSFWDLERKYVEEAYQTIPFPFQTIANPDFQMEFFWDLAMLEGYLNTWSSVGKFIKTNGYNPINELIVSLSPFWKENEQKKIIFPIFVKLGII
ncbi:class I SAM-dependent methyltransferase [Thermoflexibacter ruber]|uniref:Methyltransferase domain-containing protein n=1 Tax=Thermoflexibacter ruber TaxID=1003 RepID=A0A1I2CMZ4_9BACT|nr:class I SAM-dependent methyltransferase [Thermoflexibacter ruber]SFE69769.1 Methyltransferase domain-containing protein [Thermoflexibacter ruber]